MRWCRGVIHFTEPFVYDGASTVFVQAFLQKMGITIFLSAIQHRANKDHYLHCKKYFELNGCINQQQNGM
jgi:hypothetical protein